MIQTDTKNPLEAPFASVFADVLPYYVGSDASRVRTRMVQITDYMLTEDFVGRFHKFVKPIFKKTSERLLIEKPETYKGMTDAQEKELAKKMSHLYKFFLEVCINRPYKVDIESVIIVELLYQIVNNNDIRYKTLQEFLIYADIQYTQFGELMLKERNLEEGFMQYDAFHNYLQETTTDPQFAVAFVFTLSQTAPIDIDAFLDFQKPQFDGKFNRFVSIVIRENDSLFTEIQLEIIREWLDSDALQVQNDKKKATETPTKNNINQKPVIDFHSVFVDDIFDVLKNYFQPLEYDKLQTILNGGTIEGTIYFRGNSASLLSGLRGLLDNKLILSGQAEMIRWLVCYVTADNQKNGTNLPILSETAERYLQGKKKNFA